MEIIDTILQEKFDKIMGGLSAEQQQARQKALDYFQTNGFPTRKNEEYKYTPTDRLIGKSFDIDQHIDQFTTELNVSDHFFDIEGNHLVMINGEYQRSLSKLADASAFISQENKTVAGSYTDSFQALNDAFHCTTLSIAIPKNTEVSPVLIYHFYDSSNGQVFGNPRIDISAAVGANIKILEKTITTGSNPVFINKQATVHVDSNASVNITKVQNYAKHIYQVYNLNVNQQRDSLFNSNTFSFAGGLIRNNLNIKQLGENCESHMHGLYLLNGQCHVDNHTSVDHTMPNCYSNELYKGIVDENAKAVFNGKIYVRPNAQKTNAFQSNKNINLSDTASIHTKPQLEIWADDVKCSHGCTIGQLDEEALFYLRARGLSKASAKALMLVAFSEESFEYIPFDFVKEELHQLINKRLVG